VHLPHSIRVHSVGARHLVDGSCGGSRYPRIEPIPFLDIRLSIRFSASLAGAV